MKSIKKMSLGVPSYRLYQDDIIVFQFFYLAVSNKCSCRKNFHPLCSGWTFESQVEFFVWCSRQSNKGCVHSFFSDQNLPLILTAQTWKSKNIADIMIVQWKEST